MQVHKQVRDLLDDQLGLRQYYVGVVLEEIAADLLGVVVAGPIQDHEHRVHAEHRLVAQFERTGSSRAHLAPILFDLPQR